MEAISLDSAGRARAGWRLRGMALLAGAAWVTALYLLMVWTSITTQFDGDDMRGVEIYIAEKPAPAPERARSRRLPPNAAPNVATAAPPRADQAVLAQMLACFGALSADQRRARNCPAIERPPEWRGSTRLPMGGDYVQEEPVDYHSLYTRAEVGTLIMPQCYGSHCGNLGPPPPPPTLSAAEVCERGGIGPCHPPPFRADAPTATR